MQQLFFFALHHLHNRDTCPSRHNAGNILGVDLLFDQGLLSLHHAELGLNLGIFLLLLLHLGITDFSHLGIIALALGTLGIEIQLLDVDLVLLNAVYKVLFGFPFRRIVLFFLAHFGQFFLDDLHLFLIAFALYGFTLDFFLSYTARYVIESLRHRVDFQAQL